MFTNWRVNNGVLCAGSLRIAKMDYDTDPSEEFKKEVEDFIANSLNQAAQTHNSQITPLDCSHHEWYQGECIHCRKQAVVH